MEVASTYLVAIFLCALVAVWLRLPPLVGFLGAGFLLHALGVPQVPALEPVSDLGVTLLLFGIGLKLDARLLLRREVWLTAMTHMATFAVLGAGMVKLVMIVVPFLDVGGWHTMLIMGFALSFSSTVLVVKMLDERGETQSLFGRLAIGVLVVQDVAAVVFIAVSERHLPSPWAVTLLLLVPLTWVLRRVWSRIGHGEMTAIFGIVVALVPGYAFFDAVGLKGDIGALIMGVALAGHPAATDLARTLFTVKELLLVGFFVSIGYAGVPSAGHMLGAALLLALIPAQGWTYSLLLRTFGFRRRTTSRAGVALANFSEFGLIVAAIATGVGWLQEDWLTIIAVAVSASFVLSAAAIKSETLADWYAGRLPRDPPEHLLHPECRAVDVGDAQAVVLGMGRVGLSAAQQLRHAHGMRVVGVEQSREKQEQLVDCGVRVIEADAGDALVWDSIAAHPQVQLVVLALPSQESNLEVLGRARRRGFAGVIAAVARYPDHAQELLDSRADVVLQVYSGAGAQLADEARDFNPGQPTADGQKPT